MMKIAEQAENIRASQILSLQKLGYPNVKECPFIPYPDENKKFVIQGVALLVDYLTPPKQQCDLIGMTLDIEGGLEYIFDLYLPPTRRFGWIFGVEFDPWDAVMDFRDKKVWMRKNNRRPLTLKESLALFREYPKLLEKIGGIDIEGSVSAPTGSGRLSAAMGMTGPGISYAWGGRTTPDYSGHWHIAHCLR